MHHLSVVCSLFQLQVRVEMCVYENLTLCPSPVLFPFLGWLLRGQLKMERDVSACDVAGWVLHKHLHSHMHAYTHTLARAKDRTTRDMGQRSS